MRSLDHVNVSLHPFQLGMEEEVGGGYAECQVPHDWVVWEEKSVVITMNPKQEGRAKGMQGRGCARQS